MAIIKGRGSAAAAAAIAVVVGLLALAPGAYGATYVVGGDTQKWDFATNGYTYDAKWVPLQTFRVGDVLRFTYTVGQHDVVEYATKGEYDLCAGTTLQRWQTGDDRLTLNSTGTKYFICSVPGHCTGGMKVAVPVVAATVAPGPAPTPSAPPPATPPTTTPATPPATTPATPPATTPATTPASPPSTIVPPPPPASTNPPGSNAASSGPTMAGLLAAALVACFAYLV